MSQPFCLEPELIAAAENVMPDVHTDLLLAKNFLKQQSAATGDSVYDHLVDLVHKILTEKPPDVADQFEQYSWMVKHEKMKPNFDILNEIYMDPPQMALVNRMDEMFRLVQQRATKRDENIEEEQELDLEEDLNKPTIADFLEHNYYFREGGYGLPEQEAYAVYLSLLMLGIREPVARVRFFGKIFGSQANYYIAECDLTDEEMDLRIRAFDMRDMAGEGEGEIEAKSLHDEHEAKDEELEGEGVELPPVEPQPPALPPLPESTWLAPQPIPVERPGQGINKKYYYVCNTPGEPWVCLPDVTPPQVRVARQCARVMTGKLETEIQSFPPFEGTEANFLRAQIARIAAANSISPQGFYTFGSGEEEEDVDMEEGMGDLEFNVNPYFRGHTIKDLADPGLSYWVHHGRHILNQGRTIWWNPNILDEALEEEEDEDAPPVIPPEAGPPLFTSLAEDARIEGAIRSWTPRVSTNVMPDRALVTMRSNLWPGAVAYATNGKNSECLYVGWGLKFNPPNLTPVQLPTPQLEYVVGPEVMEMQDPTFAEEEAYRIARLPPPPPPELPGEGEGFGEDEFEED